MDILISNSNHPIVSIAITTYNSSLFVIETLESLFKQTYKNLELIVSDDASTDNTLQLVEEWVGQLHVKKRFQRIEIIAVPKNTGVSANCNRCIAAAKSDWIKFIAGDDILLDNCIADNMAFVAQNPLAKIMFSQVKVYQDTFLEKDYLKTTPQDFPDNMMQSNLTAKDQFQLLLECDRIHYTPSYFFNKEALSQVGNYDEGNRLVEDYPMWLKLTNAGIKLHYFHKPTVGYRIHSQALNNTGQDLLFKPSVINGYKVRKIYAHPYLPKSVVLQEKWVYEVTKLFKRIGIVKKDGFNSALYRGMTIYANPFFYYNSFLNRIK